MRTPGAKARDRQAAEMKNGDFCVSCMFFVCESERRRYMSFAHRVRRRWRTEQRKVKTAKTVEKQWRKVEIRGG